MCIRDRRLTGRDALIVSCALDTGLTFKVDEPAKVGRDRIADAAAAAAHYPLPCMTVDVYKRQSMPSSLPTVAPVPAPWLPSR